MSLKALKKVSARLTSKCAHLKGTVYYQRKEKVDGRVPKGGCDIQKVCCCGCCCDCCCDDDE